MTTPSQHPSPAFWSSFESGDPQPDPIAGESEGDSDRGQLTVQVTDGPSSGYTAKRRVGFTGVRCLAYSGEHRTAGRAHLRRQIFAVSVPVTATSQLAYKIMPADPSDGRALPAPGSYVAVDLAFSDGTFLSDLGVRDQYGFRLSGAGQGEAKVLLANQWNSVRSEIGHLAAGRTIRAIIIDYDRDGDAGPFAGWIDDLAITDTSDPARRPRLSDWVDTRRGTNSNGAFSRGGVIPAVAVPHGFNFWTPVTDAGSRKWLYHYQQQNNADNLPTLQALSLSHIAYPWGIDHGTFQVMPSTDTGVPNPDHVERALAFRHEDEIARAHYYSVIFENGLRAEITPTDHAAVFRFTFPSDDANLIFDNIDGHARGLRLDLDRGRLSAVSGGDTETGRGRMFITATFDRPAVAGGSLQGERGGMGYLRFDTSASRTLQMRIATSRISLAQAEHNLELEIGDRDFGVVHDQAQQIWDETLGVVSDVQGATPEQLTTLYSSLYRMSLYQNSMFENVGTAEEPEYRHAVLESLTGGGRHDHGFDAEATTRPGTMRSSTVFWDTYRTTWPALSLFYPEKTGHLLDGIVTSYRESGWLGRGMVGSSSDVTLADAYLRGVPGFDVQGAYESMIKNATVASADHRLGRPGLHRSIFLGYNALAEPIGGSDEGTAEALENYLNDFGIANLAEALHDQTGDQQYLDHHRYFLNRALGYVHLFDPATGFFQGRTADGRWRHTPETYDPRVWGYDYTETNGWGMAFAVPHDGCGLANLYGGRDGLAAKLDEFFSTPERMDDFGSYGGIIHEQREAAYVQFGQWGQSNQPAFHIPHLYNCAGQPYKAQAIIRTALARLFVGSDIGQGYPGDEDTGSMSAWFVLNALGLYPLRVGSPTFVIGSPLFRSATINLSNGNKIRIQAPNNNPDNIYVQRLLVNGEPYDRSEISHRMLTAGATLEFDLGAEPSAWATGSESGPESITAGGRPPAPMRDLTGPDAGTLISTDGQDAVALVDNDSETELIFDRAQAELTWQVADHPATAELYTLTSASGAEADPVSWTLQGSADGEQWVTLDQRDGESFTWRRQTRVFSITEPGAYQQYRITLSGTGQSLALAEIELIGHPAA